MASAALYLRTNSCNPAYTGVPYRGIGKYSDCLLLLSLRCCTSLHLHRHRSLMCGTGKLSAQSHNFWLFALPDCSKSHICHPTDNSSVCRDGFGHSSPLSPACCNPGIRHTVPVHEIPLESSVHRILYSLADNHRGRLEWAHHCRLYITTYRMFAPPCVPSHAKPDMLSRLHAPDHALKVLHPSWFIRNSCR